jgi:hypothetical protein
MLLCGIIDELSRGSVPASQTYENKEQQVSSAGCRTSSQCF